MSGVNRRGFLTGVAGAAAVGGLEVSLAEPAVANEQAAAPGAAAEDSHGRVPLTLREGTNLAAAISPDGRTVAMDLAGVLWLVPAAGGTARRLTEDIMDIAQPEWSPDSKTLAFQSYRDGNFNLWTIRADGGGLRQLTHGPFDHREPRFSPDGRKLAYSGDATGSYAVHILDLATGKDTVVADTTAEEYEPAWSPDGTRLAFVVTNTKIDVVTLAGGARSTLVTAGAKDILHNPSFTPDGKDVVYSLLSNGSSTLQRSGTPFVTGEEVFPFRVTWHGREFVYTADGRIRRRSLDGGKARDIAFAAALSVTRPKYRKRRRDFDSTGRKPVLGIGSPVASPDGRQVAFRALNDIYLMRIGDSPRPLTRDKTWKCDPAFSADGRYLSYSTDRAGTLDIWIRDLHTGRDRQLTNLPDRAALSANFSPDGRHLAFLDQDGALYEVEVATGAVRQLFTATFEPGRPVYTKDGGTVALAAVKPYSSRYREGLSKILLVNRGTGKGVYVDPMPDRSLQTRGDDGPVFSPDGTRMAFVVASVLWVVPVRPDGTFAGKPRKVTDEVTDAPSWAGDDTLLYLSNGRLRRIAAGGGKPRTVQVGLSWTNSKPRGRKVIRAGRMWDGRSRTLRSDVDIVVEGHRITALARGGSVRDAEIVNARDSVVIPGIVDMHNHREMQGYAYGARQNRVWLSLGITTTRSPGSPAYHMVEERESVQSGARLGPRYFATGEAIDGSRIYYNFMRPTFDLDQLALELQRAEALDYDLMKSYVRMRTEWQRRIIEFSHRKHIHATSHYPYPAFDFGGDGMEHTGATNRLGYSRTVTTLGTGYSDVISMFNASRAAHTPTLFGAQALFRDDTSLVTDRRVRTLYPPWEYATLQESVDTAKNTDQTANLENLRRQVKQAIQQVRGGGLIITGTDSPIDHTAVSTHMNLRAMVRYGMTPYEALTTATRNAGEFLEEPLGTIERGNYADLAVLGGDPLKDIDQAANVSKVVVSGVVHTVEELLRPYAGTRSTVEPSRMLAPLPEHPDNAGFWWHDPEYVKHAKHSCCTG